MNYKLILLLIFTFFSFSFSSSQSETLINYAKQFLGTPYVYGGETPAGFDCSGFCQYVYKHALGIDISRTTRELIYDGREVTRAELQPGDLVFPSNHHVTLYIGNNEVIHAPQTGDVVKISKIEELNGGFWRARRILPDEPSEPTHKFKSIFDAEFYARKYPDLKKKYGNDNSKLSKHFYSLGIREGKCASPVFDVDYYLNTNKDLKNAFGTDYLEAYNHFITFGWNENRDLSPVFHLGYYKENNPDIGKVYGESNTEEILNHFMVYGLKEGRVSSPNFNLQTYKKKNKDLVTKFGNDNKEYYIHYLLEGKSEGREAI